MNHFDVIIIGAGPAGASAAGTAARAGLKTLILEKAKLQPRGRYKACGGAMGWELVERTQYTVQPMDRIIEEFVLHHFSGKIYHKRGKGAVVWRSSFDFHLIHIAQKFGAVLHECEPLQGIDRNPSGEYICHTPRASYQAKYIIAADGVTSPTLQFLGWPRFSPDNLVLTITQEHQSTTEEIAELLGSEHIHLFFGKSHIDTGYAWLFPKQEIITVGWGNRLSCIRNTAQEFQKFLDEAFVRTCLQNTRLLRKTAHLIPVGIRDQIYHENVFAVGDAGGFVDPISGKGIPYAILSGKYAVESFLSSSRQFGEKYQELLDSHFLSILQNKVSLRERIFESDKNLHKFLDLWQTHRTSAILSKNLL